MKTTTTLRSLLRMLPILVLLLIASIAAADGPEERMEIAREALNRAEYEKAAQLYNQIFLETMENELAGNALYWEAFSRYRLNRTEELKLAAELLTLQAEKYREAETLAEGEALAARIYGELARRGEAGAAYEVSRRLSDEEAREETQMAALHALMQMDPDKAIPVLEKIVRGEKKVGPEMRRNAIFMLCHEGNDRSVDLLIELLRSSTDADLQSELVMCLSMVSSDKALDAIVDFFRSNEGSDAGREALYAIGNHGGDRAFDLLAEIVADRTADDEMRAEALFSLSRTGRDEQVAKILTDVLANETSPEILEMALYSLSHLESAVPDKVFMDLIQNPAADVELRAQALYFAAQRDQITLEFVQQMYASTDSREMKIQICHVLTQMDDEKAALGTLIDIVREETDPEILRDAVFWIGQFDDPRAAEFLLEVINQE